MLACALVLSLGLGCELRYQYVHCHTAIEMDLHSASPPVSESSRVSVVLSPARDLTIVSRCSPLYKRESVRELGKIHSSFGKQAQTSLPVVLFIVKCDHAKGSPSLILTRKGSTSKTRRTETCRLDMPCSAGLDVWGLIDTSRAKEE